MSANQTPYSHGVDLMVACSAALILPLALLSLIAAFRRRSATEYWVLMSVSAGISYLARLLDIGWVLLLGLALQAALCGVGLARFSQDLRSRDHPDRLPGR